MGPEYLILESQDKLLFLDQMAREANFEHDEFFSSYMVNEIIERCKCLQFATTELNAFIASVYVGEAEYGYDTIPESFADSLLDLGEFILSQLIEFRLYDIDGVLRYHYNALCDPHPHFISLKRNHELPYYPQTSPHSDRQHRAFS